MAVTDPAVLNFLGKSEYDRNELRRRYAHERDVRLRPDKNQQYVETTAEFSHYIDDPYIPLTERNPLRDHVDVAIIGGGIGGLLVGAHLRQYGFDDIRIIEKGGDLGGVWYWNRFPGLRCDTEAYIYIPLIEEIGDFPTEKYGRGSEIHAHLLKIARKYDLYRNACLQTGVTGVAWNEDEERWHIRTDRGDHMTARCVVMANGQLSKPKLPGIPGIDQFKGHTFHTSRWDYGYTAGDETGNLTGLADKKVGVIGTGATAIQVIPALGASSQELYVFQRTPAAVDVRANRPTDPQWAASLDPGWQARRNDNFNRVASGLPEEVDLVNDGFTELGKLADPTAAWAEPILGRSLTPEEGSYIAETFDDLKMNAIRARIDEIVKDPKTAEALKPWHRRYCKRPLFSDEYLPTFNRPNVTLVDTDGQGVERITPTGVVVAGKHYDVDCLIFATGFEVGTEFTRRAGYDVVGTGGMELRDYWKNGMRTFQGIFTRGFPNCFLVNFGQNAVANSFTFVLEEQAKHVAHTLNAMRNRRVSVAEPSEAAVESYVAEVKPLSYSQSKFWKDCTPSYFNGEGLTENPHGFFANVHPAGPVVFYDTLEKWRANDDLAGLELR
ncbi:MAG: monooxygenase [Sphingomonadales bacterium]|nr:monooxygenase [Sphingomonadales bacterium]